MLKGMLVDIYKPADGADCTNGGVTSRATGAIVVGDVLETNGRGKVTAVLGKVPEIFVAKGDLPVLRIEKRRQLSECSGCGDNGDGDQFWYIVAVPVGPHALHVGRVVETDFDKVSFAAGGNFIYSCDSRFRQLLSEYPIPVHDHIIR